MKKRSLVSALAMLIVSALVLTTATYAWFASGTTISVASYQATVDETTGGLWLSVDNTNWVTSIAATDFTTEVNAAQGNVFATNFIPVSKLLGGALNAGELTLAAPNYTFAASGDPGAGYVKYKIYIKSDSDRTVTVTANLGATAPFVYAGIETSAGAVSGVIADSAARTYQPITGSNWAGTDTNSNGIMDGTTELNVGTLPEAISTVADSSSVSLTLAGGVVQSFTVFMWAEGQDSGCVGSVPSTTATISLAISAA